MEYEMKHSKKGAMFIYILSRYFYLVKYMKIDFYIFFQDSLYRLFFLKIKLNST